MRTDLIDVDIAGHQIRVLCEVPQATTVLRGALSEHLLGEPAEPGFVLKQPDRPGGLHVLLDRAGFILARSRSWEDCVAVLARHLGVFLPPHLGTVRLAMRVLLGDDGRATLVGFPLFSTPPVVERRLQRVGQRIVDRLVVDVHPDGRLDMTATPWASEFVARDVVGHAEAAVTGASAWRVLLPQVIHGPVSEGSAAASIAAGVRGTTSHETSMAIALAILRASPVEGVPWDERLMRYEILSTATIP